MVRFNKDFSCLFEYRAQVEALSDFVLVKFLKLVLNINVVWDVL